jgi:hypothetical protein
MKPFILLKLSVVTLGLGAALLLAPACKAQSEISPDHFDGTDPWESALAQKNAGARNKQAKAPASSQSLTNKPGAVAVVKLASQRADAKPVRQDATAIQEKRKVSPRKADKQ